MPRGKNALVQQFQVLKAAQSRFRKTGSRSARESELVAEVAELLALSEQDLASVRNTVHSTVEQRSGRNGKLEEGRLWFDDQWSSHDKKSHKGIWTLREQFLPADDDPAQDDYNEGKRQACLSTRPSRDPQLPEERKNLVRSWRDDRKLSCELCKFVMIDCYGARGESVIDVHHLDFFAYADGPVRTRLDRVRAICPNCHRLAHTKNDVGLYLTWDELQAEIGRYGGSGGARPASCRTP